MKRLFRLSGILLIMILAFAVSVSAETAYTWEGDGYPPDDQCPSPNSSDGHHEWNLIEQVSPGCTEGGYNAWECGYCFSTYRQNLPPNGHHWDNGTVTREPTCAQEGVRTFTCVRGDGATRTEAIPAKAHTPAPIPGRAPTCTAEGLTEGSRCSVCGTVLTAQQAIPMTAHTPTPIPGRGATCTAAGLTEGSRCAVCGTVLAAQQNVPALGHDWDGGKTTPGEGFADGVTVYTCRRCGGTREETVPATAGSVMNLLRIDTRIPKKPLTISLQPEGGLIDYDGGSHVMTVGTADGTAPYTYVWHYVGSVFQSPVPHSSALAEFAAAQTEAAGGIFQERGGSFAEDFSRLITGIYEPSGTSAADFAAIIQNAADNRHAFDRVITDADDASYEATAAGRYYCVIFDVEGRKGVTDLATVGYKLHITRQPVNTNMAGEATVLLRIDASGGVPDEGGDYQYRWYREDGTELDGWDPDTHSIPIDTTGRYYAVVEDAAGTQITSDTVTVYDADPLFLQSNLVACRIIPGQTTEDLSMTFGDGVPPYSCVWTVNGETVESFIEEEASTSVHTAAVPGTYEFTVTDYMGETRSKTVDVRYWQLGYRDFTLTPNTGVLPKDGQVEITITMTEGKAPYTFTLMRGEESLQSVTQESRTCSFPITSPGMYTILAEDANGRWAEPDPRSVKDYYFEVKDYDLTAEITRSELEPMLSFVLSGGEYPVTTHWYWHYTTPNGVVMAADWEGKTISSPSYINDEKTDVRYSCPVDRPGYYTCVFTDKNGEVDFNMFEIEVTYTGREPLIVLQPEGKVYPYTTPLDKFEVDMTCEAIIGSDDVEPDYAWYQYVDGAWTRISTHAHLGMNGDVSGIYKCLVTGPRNSFPTFSQPAVIQREFSIDDIRQTGFSDGKAFFNVTVKGGAGPYYVYVYRIEVGEEHSTFYHPDDHEYVDSYQLVNNPVLYDSFWDFGKMGADGRHVIPLSLDRNYTYSYHPATINFHYSSQTTTRTVRCTYMVEIRDKYGMTVESEEFTVD